MAGNIRAFALFVSIFKKKYILYLGASAAWLQ